jgi:hypothetical protein
MVYLQKIISFLGTFLRGQGAENVGLFSVHLEYFILVLYNICRFGVLCGHWVYFFLFWFVVPGKFWHAHSLHTYILSRPQGVFSLRRFPNFRNLNFGPYWHYSQTLCSPWLEHGKAWLVCPQCYVGIKRHKIR